MHMLSFFKYYLKKYGIRYFELCPVCNYARGKQTDAYRQGGDDRIAHKRLVMFLP